MKPVGKDGVLGIVVSLLVVAAVVRGLFMIGPIEEQRNRKFDERRLSDLQRIVSSVEFYYRNHKELPENLDTLAELPGSRVSLFDPESGKPPMPIAGSRQKPTSFVQLSRWSPMNPRLCAGHTRLGVPVFA